ncbi:hypothetical protein [Hyphomonas sp. KY3]|uniref:hypothetical protein n=1 Tax=Hyphomonas sp. KY3 TaxID=2016196 RepID=UPI001A8E5C70|nr:hypothetical protein [Hyphomonas sp. KY3]QSR20991.1 hypothetical protein CFA77_01640 [Hyphomonas sp. KY3]
MADDSPPVAQLGPEQLVDLWKQSISTQMHFNDLCVRSRQLGLTFVVAALGLNVVLLSNFEDARLNIACLSIHISAAIMFIAAIAVVAVWRLDLGVYHKMLRGSVAFVEDLDEKVIVPRLSPLQYGMTRFISEYSRHSDVKYENGVFTSEKEKLAGQKVRDFYCVVVFVLTSIGILIAVFV